MKHMLPAPFGKLMSIGGQGALVAEIARGDASAATMFIVQYGLLTYTIHEMGSEEQKQKYIPKLMAFDWIGGWGLTEDKIGSDASNIQTTATKVDDNTYKLNGTKRWIGNGNRDLLVIWAKNTDTKNVEGFIVENNNVNGLVSQPIKHKLPLRPVQNCHITLHNTIVKESDKLPKAKDFASGVNKILKHSRILVCWIAMGVCLGVYDAAIKYVSDRKQFGLPISSYQLVQEKIVKMMAQIQASLALCFQVSKLADEGKATIGQIAMVKAYVTSHARDIARWGREVYGGNGIIHEHYPMRALADLEGIYTYEGTYEVNTLVAGRELTGISAFKR